MSNFGEKKVNMCTKANLEYSSLRANACKSQTLFNFVSKPIRCRALWNRYRCLL